MEDGTTRSEGLSGEQFLLRILMDALPDYIYFKDRDSRFTRINRALAALLGLSDPTQAVGKSDRDFFLPDFAQRAFDAERQIMQTGQPQVDVEERGLLPNGTLLWLSTTKMPLRDDSGAVVGTFGLSRDISAHKRDADRLRDSEALYHSLVENLPQNIFRKDIHGHFTFANQRFCSTLGKPMKDILGKTDADFFPPDLAAKYQEDDRRIIKTGQIFETSEEHQIPGREHSHVRIVKTPIYDAKGYIVGVQGMFWDVTDLMRAQDALVKSEERYALAIAGAHDGIWDWDLVSNQIHYSARWQEMLGLQGHEVGTDPDEWMRRIHPEDTAAVRSAIAAHLSGQSASLESEHRMRHKDRGYRWMLIRGVAVRDASGKVTRMAGSQADITDRKRTEEELTHQAFYDSLTDLPNRLLFVDRLNQTIRRAKRKTNSLFAVLFLDLDRFKDVNDSLGHSAGDLLLTATGRRLEACVRPGDTVARMGGDEFAVLLEEMRDPDDAVQVAERILKDLKQPLIVEGREVFSSASIGIAPGVAYERPEDLLRDADTAMYRAKERGKACYEVFDQAMHFRAVSRLNLETDLRHALERGEFRVFYQPIIAVHDDRIAGFEALVRWQHPTRGLVSPADFLPLAEETGLILPMDLWVLREACAQTRRWQALFPRTPPLSINVNLSCKHFVQPGIVTRVSEALRETGLDGDGLRLEITESVLMEESASLTQLLADLKALRLKLYLDDFGTGYSSLGYLHRFPIDSLKIHHSFVGQLGRESDQAQLVKTITTIADNLGMGVVAEGVETEEQYQRLRELRCDRVQGFLFSRPVDAAAAGALLAAPSHWGLKKSRSAGAALA